MANIRQESEFLTVRHHCNSPARCLANDGFMGLPGCPGDSVKKLLMRPFRTTALKPLGWLLPFRRSQLQLTFEVQLMSALPPKADIAERDRHVRFVPIADIEPPSLDHLLTDTAGSTLLQALRPTFQAAGGGWPSTCGKFALMAAQLGADETQIVADGFPISGSSRVPTRT
jgi:hypothetical protein